MFNKITLLGNLTKDIELSYPNEKAFGRGAVAVNRKYRAKENGELKEEVLFLNFIVNGPLAEAAHQYLKKGSKVFFEGRLTQNDYTGSDGVLRIGYQVVVSEMRFLDAKPNDLVNAAKTQSTAQQATPAQTQNQQADAFDDDNGASLPF